jgi:hypothetical protein
VRGDNRLRVRLVQVSAILLVAGLAVAACVLAWIAIDLRNLSGDISKSRARLPASVSVALPKDTSILSHRQVTLVRYSKGVAQGAAVLFTTVPDQQLAGFLVLPPSTVVRGSRISALSNTDAIRALQAGHIPISHVALIDPDKVPEIVDRVGGVALVNRVAFTVQDSNGQTFHFPAGVVHLDGRAAALYLKAVTTRESLEAGSAALLSAVVHALLQPTGFDQLQSIGAVFAHAASTDLRPSDVLGLVDLRLRGGSVVRCRLPRAQPISAWGSAIDATLGVSTAIPAQCHRKILQSSGVTPPIAVVKIVQHYGWRLFMAAAIAFGALAALMAGLLAARWPGRRRRTKRRVARTPVTPQSGDVVWSGRGDHAGRPVVDLTRKPESVAELEKRQQAAPAAGDAPPQHDAPQRHESVAELEKRQQAAAPAAGDAPPRHP